MSGFELSPWIVILLVTLASARTFRLLAYDDITLGLRKAYGRLVGHLPDRKAAAMWDALFCPWCSGYWWAAGWTITALAWHDTLLWQLLAISFAANYVAAVLNGIYDVVHEVAEEKANDD